MVAFLFKRLLQSIFVVFGVACVVFFLIRLVPGDPAALMLPPGSSEEQVEIVRRELGADQPLLVQFAQFLAGLVHGDLGNSFRLGDPVLSIVLKALPYTLVLGVTTMALAILVAVPLGIAAAYWNGGLLDRSILILSEEGRTARFQDPYASLPPRMRIGRIVEEPFRIHGLDRRGKATALLERVDLPPRLVDRYPNELSGGQRQRVVIARALALEPSLVVCDEAVSALDVSVQARILELFERLQADFGLTYMFISHDLGVVRHISEQLAVMYLGDVVERGLTANIYDEPFHPYTWTLLWVMPSVYSFTRRTRRGMPVRGDQPSPLNVPSGCKFRTRCPLATEKCRAERPPLRRVDRGRWAACHYAEEVPERMSLYGESYGKKGLGTNGGA
jgi:oligopeptide/dipeptide ABC transporter ATP-binding protein